MIMNKQTIITILFALVAVAGQGQSSFDVEEGCLNVIDVTLAQGVGEYGDKCISATPESDIAIITTTTFPLSPSFLVHIISFLTSGFLPLSICASVYSPCSMQRM